MRIRTRVLILVLSVLLPSFVAAGLAVTFVYSKEQQSQARSVTEAARAFALLVDNELENNEAILATLANSPSLARGDFAGFYAHARRMAPTPESAVVLTDLSGRQLLNTRAPLGSPLPQRRVSNLGELMQRYGGERMLVSDLFFAPLVKHYNFTIQVPVKIEGRTRYYLSMGVSASSLQPLLARQHFRDEWLVSLVDRKGMVVARSRAPAQFVGRPIRSSTTALLAGSTEGVFESRTLEGVPVLAYYSTVPNAGWKVLLNIPESEVRAVPLRTATLLGAVLAVVLALGLLAARWFARRAIGPIEYLGRSARELGQGEELVHEAQGVLEIDAVARSMAEASRKIRLSQKELEQQVADAVAATERAQSALLKSQKLEALGRLTGGIAHEFNNLLQTLTTALQLATMANSQPKVQGLLDTCKKTVGRAATLTARLGSFGRVQEARLLTVDAGAQLGSAVQLMRGVLRADIELQVQRGPDLWPVTIEPLQFELALLNLAINARDAMPGSGRLVICAVNLAQALPPGGLPEGDYVLVTVSDTGAGMAPDVLARALDPFFTTKAQGQGTGLGLAQAYAFAIQSQGTLVLHSVPGDGTRVEIYLPRALGVAQVETAPAAQPAAMRGRGKVLFVEDDPLVRAAVAPALAQSGFEVMEAENGDAALAMLERGAQPDVVFSDVVMPGRVNGIELARIVRQHFPALPVILASGYTEQQAALPGVRILAKPYAIDRIVALLSQAAASSKASAPAAG